MTFFICSLVHCNQQLPAQREELSLLNSPQIVTSILDLVAAVGILALAGLILANNAQSIHLPGLGQITNQTAYILLGSTGAALLIDFSTFAIQTCKKFKAMAEKFKTEPSIQNSVAPEHNSNIHNEFVQKQILLDQQTQKITQLEQQMADVHQKRNSEVAALKVQLSELKAKLEEQNSNKELLSVRLECQTIKNKLAELSKDTTAELEIVAIPVKLVVDDSNENCPYIEAENLYVSNAQAKLMEKDPYFKNYVSGNFDTTIKDGELFLNNLTLFLSPSINALCQQADSLGSLRLQEKIVGCEKEFSNLFVTLGLSKDKAFIHHNGEAIGAGLQVVLDNLAHANMMGNKVLVVFWCQALRKHMPFNECIDLFSQIIELPLQHPECLHELLFEHLVLNHKKSETQEFLQKNKGKLFINTLNLDLFLEIVEPSYDHPKLENQAELDKFLNVINLESVKVLSRGYGNTTADCYSKEFIYVLEKCNQCVCIREGRTITGRNVSDYSNLKKRIPIVDLSDYQSRRDSLGLSGEIVIFKFFQRKKIGLIYLKEHEETTNKYLIDYYGVSLVVLNQAQNS